METISVIIPVYNAEKTISDTVRAVLGQSWSDLELILVNDGSRDGSGAICDRFAEEDDRVRVIHRENAGVSAARNLGLKQASGTYVTFLDADDLVPSDYLEILHRACENGDISVCDVVSIQDGQEKQRFTMRDCVLSRTEALNCLLSRRNINSGPCAKLFRRTVIEGLVFPPLRVYEDILFVRDAFCQTERIEVTNRTEYRYIQNPEGAMSGLEKAHSLDVVKATESILQFICAEKELCPETFYITVSHLMQYAQGAVNMPGAESFVRQAQKLYRKYILRIFTCPAFSKKEKIVFLMFAFGWFYKNRKFTWIGV